MLLLVTAAYAFQIRVVRHGARTPISTDKSITVQLFGREPGQLTQKGYQAAIEKGKFFNNQKQLQSYSASSKQRSIQTAKGFLQGKGQLMPLVQFSNEQEDYLFHSLTVCGLKTKAAWLQRQPIFTDIIQKFKKAYPGLLPEQGVTPRRVYDTLLCFKAQGITPPQLTQNQTSYLKNQRAKAIIEQFTEEKSAVAAKPMLQLLNNNRERQGLNYLFGHDSNIFALLRVLTQNFEQLVRLQQVQFLSILRLREEEGRLRLWLDSLELKVRFNITAQVLGQPQFNYSGRCP